MTTVHANGPDEAIVRLEGMALLAGVPLPAAQAQVAAALDLVVALDRDREGRRRVAAVSRWTSRAVAHAPRSGGRGDRRHGDPARPRPVAGRGRVRPRATSATSTSAPPP
jgi:hypothetical protein